MKALLVVLDGLGDRPVPELNYLTPLESARTPNLNALADKGITGMIDSIGVGVRPGSDVSHLALLGYDPKQVYTGRGPFEAAGAGIKLKQGDLCFRVNFATVDKKGVIADRRAGRIMSVAAFEPALNAIKLNGVDVLFKAGVSHRGALVFRPSKGVALSQMVCETDPHVALVRPREVKPLDATQEAKRTAALANEFLAKASAVLAKHGLNRQRVKEHLLPANALLLRGAGFAPELVAFEQKHGLSAGCVAGAAMYKGLSRLLGMELAEVKGATGRGDTDLSAKVAAAQRLLERKDFVFLHVKATDSFGEDGDFVGKRNFIERVDDALAPLVSWNNGLVVVTADHSTACALKAHTGDPVPVLMAGPGVRRDAVRKFGERDCARGGLGRLRGLDVMREVVNLLGRAKLYGA